MKTLLLYSFCFFYIANSFAQDQATPHLLHWELDEKLHLLEISSLPKRLPKALNVLELSYQKDHSNSKDFFTLGRDDFYTKRQNAFKINKRRYSGVIKGYDEEGDLRFVLEFRKGKLDGSYIIYHTDGSKSTKVYSKGLLLADTVRVKEEK
jgi:hypothetical protein